jgi:hypothetical protein
MEPMLVVPRDPEASVLYQRDKSEELSERMPPLGRNRLDERYLELLDRWILSL